MGPYEHGLSRHWGGLAQGQAVQCQVPDSSWSRPWDPHHVVRILGPALGKVLNWYNTLKKKKKGEKKRNHTAQGSNPQML